jgi:hypothetical protein
MMSGLARRTALFAALVALAGLMTIVRGQERSSDSPDLDAIYRIKDEAFQRSQVMDLVSYLTDVYGPRLTGSPNLQEAAEYTVARMRAWGIANPRLETWGRFGPGWSNERFTAHVIEPQAYPLIGYPRAWTPGTHGPTTGEAILAPITEDRDFDTWRGKLRGKFVFAQRLRNVDASFEPLGRRLTDEDLENLAAQPRPPRAQAGGRGRGGQAASPREFARRRMQFFVDEGVAAIVEYSRGDGGTVFVTGGNLRQFPDAPVPTQIVLAVEHYGRIVRTLEKEIPVTLEVNVQNTFHEDDLDAFTIVGEIPGTDKADEVVMLGAHFDSWHTGTGATDNAAGAAVMLEAMRVLQTTGLQMRRTVRIGLWTGEEQGIQGSRAYVTKHFADRETMQLLPEHGRLSAYYNLDNGTGAIRGIYLQGNEAVAPIFREWMVPFENVGMTTLAIRGTGGTDHTSFDAVGLPGFQFIQDPVEYDPRTHHSNMDVYERVQREDLIKNVAIISAFAYHTANREELLPRKPLPRPARSGRGNGAGR